MRSGDIKIASEKLYELRKSRRWTQDELSDAAGLSLRTIQRAEKTGVVSISTLKSLAAVFEIDAGELEEDESIEQSRFRKWHLAPATIIVFVAVTLTLSLLAPPAAWNIWNDQESVAVLPFVSVSGDSRTTAMANALTDQLTLQLSRSQRANVIPSRDARNATLAGSSISEIGDTVSASLVVEGAVYEDSDRFQVTVQVIDVRSSSHVWSMTYSRNANEVEGIIPSVVQSVEAVYRN